MDEQYPHGKTPKPKQRRRGPYGRIETLPSLQRPYMTIDGAGVPSVELDGHDVVGDASNQYREEADTESEENNFQEITDEHQMEIEGEHKNEFDYDTLHKSDLQTADPELDEILQQVFKELKEEEESFDGLDEDPIVLESNKDDCIDYDSRALYPGASVSVGAFMLLLALFITRFGIVGEGTEVLLSIIGFALPNCHNLCTKLHEYKKFFTNLRIPLIHHYYCSYCLGSIQDTSVRNCSYDFCRKPFSKKDGNYFLEIPLKDQIKNLFSQQGFYDKLQERFTRTSSNDTYEDIYDGKLYKSHFENNGFLSNPNNISLTFNTDGAAVFKSSKVSVWPIFLVVNELPYKLRMKRENMILASLWFGNQKPAMGTFLKPFLESMKELHTGIECFAPEKGDFTLKGILLCGTADLPARSILCNHIQYNGAFACWKCEQEGCSASVGKGQNRVFPYNKICPKGPERNQHNIIDNARYAIQKGTGHIVKGIKGPSWLSFFPRFNIVNGIAIDYMHGVLLGVQKLMLELWFLPKFSSKPFNFYNKLCAVDERLLSIRPTLEITRLPRTIQNDLKYWKASEFRSFLLFYGAPVLHGILDPARFSHYLLLVNAMHVLLKFGASNEEINKAEMMLFDFVEKFEELYDRCFMRLNIHQLLHLPDSVRYLGRLYTHSCFSFEDENGALVKMIRGTQNIDSQIVTGVSFLQKLPELKQKCITKGSICETLYNSVESPCILKRGEQIFNHVYILGGVKEISLTPEERDALYTFYGHELVTMKFQSFKRIEMKDCIVYGKSYSRMIRRDNSTVEYYDKLGTVNLGQVKFFIKLFEDDKQMNLAFIEKFACANYSGASHILSVKKTNQLVVEKLENIISSCMLVDYDGGNSSYVCRFPNRMESD